MGMAQRENRVRLTLNPPKRALPAIPPTQTGAYIALKPPPPQRIMGRFPQVSSCIYHITVDAAATGMVLRR